MIVGSPLLVLVVFGRAFRWGLVVPSALLGIVRALLLTLSISSSRFEVVSKMFFAPIIGAVFGLIFGVLWELQAVRKGKWKLILPDRKKSYGYVKDKGSLQVELYNLETDIGEAKNLANTHPEIVRDLLQYAQSLQLPDKPYETRIGLGAKSPPRK